MKRTKIIATFGPALKDPKVLDTVLDKIDVLRFNFSHLSPDQAQADLSLVETALKKKSKKVALLADLKGPEIRTDENEYNIKKNSNLALVYGRGEPEKNIIGLDLKDIHKKVKVNTIVKADDGSVEFVVTGISEKKVLLKAKNDFLLKKKKSINLVKCDLNLPIISEADRKNLSFIVKENFSWIAASFVSSADDVKEIKKYIKKIPSGREIPIIAKVENYLAIKNIEEIILEAEGIMVARGDLGVEYSFDEVPILQKMIIEKSQKKGKVIIVATQMLDSMIHSPYPSRPEATDVSSAVMSRVDAVMLSGETANGKFPVHSVEVMEKIIKTTEKNIHYLKGSNQILKYDKEHFIIPFLRYGVELSQLIESKCTITISERGKSAVFLSAFKPDQFNIVATSNRELFYKMHLYYSIQPILIEKTFSKKNNNQEEEILDEIIEKLKKKRIVKKNDSIVFLFSFIYKNVYRGINSIREVKIH